MDDEPDIIKEFRLEEKSGFNVAKPKNLETELKKYPPIEPDYGGNLRKAFSIVVVIILIVAGVLLYVSAAFRETNWILKAEQAKFIGTWEVEEYYYGYSARTTWHFYENKTLKTTNYYSHTNYYSEPDCPTISFAQDKKNKSLTVTDVKKTNPDTYSYESWGTYYIGANTLHLKENSYSEYTSYRYSFSLNNTRIELNSGQSYYDKILTKSQGVTTTSDVRWENINITLRGAGSPSYNLISFDNCSFCYYNGYSAPSSWGNVSIGDYITFGDFEYDTYVDFKYIPYNQVISGFYFPSDNQTMQSDLVAYWDFEDTSDGVLYDKSGNGNSGKINGATQHPGVKGSGLYFNGYSDYVEFDSPVITTAPYSICCWAKPDSIPYSNEYILANGGESSLYNGFYLNIETSGTFNRNYTFGVNNGLAAGYATYHPNSASLAFLCGTWDGSADASNLKLYVNGELKSTGVSSTPYTKSLNNLRIGCPSTYTSYLFDGLIDEVRIYNRVLNPTEIKELYNISITPKILYVGGTGAGNYSTIQSALDGAFSGDTVYVYSGTYEENLRVNTAVHLLGENAKNTIIDGNGWPGVVINVLSPGVEIRGFTLKCSYSEKGINIEANDCDNCVYSDNIIDNACTFGFCIYGSKNCTISNNVIRNITTCGIRIYGNESSNNSIFGNHIENCVSDSIWIECSGYNNISENTITNCVKGIFIKVCSPGNFVYKNIIKNSVQGIDLYNGPYGNVISYNTLENDSYGIFIQDSSNNFIYCNNMNSNVCDYSNNAYYDQSTLRGNYWKSYSVVDANGDGVGDTPYQIACGTNQDPYPLMNPSQ